MRSSSTEAYCPVRPISRRTWGACRTTSSPPTAAWPASGRSSVARMRIAVVLPAPPGRPRTDRCQPLASDAQAEGHCTGAVTARLPASTDAWPVRTGGDVRLRPPPRRADRPNAFQRFTRSSRQGSSASTTVPTPTSSSAYSVWQTGWMRVGVLGPLEVEADGRITEIAGARLRVLLARLALDAGRMVTVESLSQALWPDEVPGDPGHALQSLVSRLRRALPGPAALRSVPGG